MMAAIAIPPPASNPSSHPFNNSSSQEPDPSTPSSFFPISCSPLSRSPFAHQLSLSPSSAANKFPLSSTQSSKPHRKSFGSHTVSSAARPTPLNRPVPPQASPGDIAELLPPVFSGSILENFKTALSEIDVDTCEAHGENAFFVADLAEVYRQHLRWMKELGERVTPFFGAGTILSSHSSDPD